MKALAIAGLSVRRMLRDRTAMFFVILLPFFIILVVGSATKQFTSDKIPLGLVVAGHGPRTNDLIHELDHTKGLVFARVDDADKLRKALRRGVYPAGVVIPRDYDARITAGRPVDVAFVADQTRPQPALRADVDAAVAKQGAIVQAAQFAAAQTKQPVERALTEAASTARIVPKIDVATITRGERGKRLVLAGFGYTAPAQLVLFAFITALAGAGVIIANRQQGITRRQYSTPTPARTIVVGEMLARFAQTAFQALFVVVVGTLLFGVNFGDPIAATALITLFVLVATSIGLLAGTVFTTPEQAGSIGPPVGIAAGMLAGCMWPRFLMPLPMQRLGQIFPQSWAMDGFVKLIAGAHVHGILPELAILAGYLVLILPLATWRLRRSIVA